MKANAAEEAQPIVFDTTAYGNQSSYGEFTFGNKWMTTSFGGGNNYTLGANKSSQASSNTFDTYSSCFSNIGELSDYKYSVAIFNLTGNELQNIYKLEMSSTKLANSTSVDVLFATSNTYLGNYELEAKTTITSSNLSSFTIELNEPSENDYYSIIFATSSSYFRLDSFKANIYTKVIKYNVNFYDGDSLISTETVNDGETVDFSLVNAEKDGYVFDGWYEDPSFTIAYDENAPVTGDLNLYAHYIAHEDLTSGEIFASETTKTSLIANATSTISEYADELKIVEDAPLESLFEYTIVTASGGSNHSKVYSDSWRVYGGNTITLSSEYTIDHITYKTDTGRDDLITSIKEITDGASIESTGNHMGTITVNSKSFSFSLDSQSRITEFTIFYSNFETIQVTNASIRFGTALSSELYDETATYGVIFGLNGEDINTLAENETSVENLLINNKTLHSAQASNIAMVDTDTGAVEESKNPETAPYFQYAIVIKDMLEHIGKEITAACYMETNDNLYVMNEVTYSVKTLSNEYLNNIEEGTLSEDYKDILNAILNYNA